MGYVTVTFATDNDTFKNWANEVAVVLHEAAIRVADGEREFQLRDRNGNAIGVFKYAEDDL